MSGQIPKYGEHFRRVSVPRDFIKDLAQTEYVSKRNPYFSVRSNGNREQWWIFRGHEILAGPYPTMTEACNRLIVVLWQLFGTKLEPMPNPVWGRKNAW